MIFSQHMQIIPLLYANTCIPLVFEFFCFKQIFLATILCTLVIFLECFAQVCFSPSLISDQQSANILALVELFSSPTTKGFILCSLQICLMNKVFLSIGVTPTLMDMRNLSLVSAIFCLSLCLAPQDIGGHEVRKCRI